MTEPADLLAVQRAHAESGRDAALAEIRRRWPNISETVLSATLERIMRRNPRSRARLKQRALSLKQRASDDPFRLSECALKTALDCASDRL